MEENNEMYCIKIALHNLIDRIQNERYLVYLYKLLNKLTE